MGENRIKLVAADMDGTLLNRERKITKYTQNVIKKAMAQGVYFVPATGRACLLYTSPSPRDSTSSRMPSSA